MPRCAEAATIAAVQRPVAEEERVRQNLRYEQQVICAKRYANFGQVFQKLYCRLFQPSLNSEQTSTPPNRTEGTTGALIEGAGGFKQGNAKEDPRKIECAAEQEQSVWVLRCVGEVGDLVGKFLEAILK